MTIRPNFLVVSAACLMLAAPLWAGDITVKDAYVRSSTPSSKSGAAFLTLMNTGETNDRLLSATSDVAVRIELHTHKENSDGVMQMIPVEDGFPVPAGGMHRLKRGGDHIMMMGLTRRLEQGDQIDLTLTFENSGDMTITIPVDRKRRPAHGAATHSNMDHSSDG